MSGLALDAPDITVIVPAFNAADFIQTALASIFLDGGDLRIEALVIDDASKDDTAAVLRALAARDGRVRCISLPRNLGPAAARNAGLASARGSYVALLDADDRYAPGRLRHLHELARLHAADIVSDNVLLCHAPPSRVPPARMIPLATLSTPSKLSAAEFVARNIGSRRQPRTSYGFMKPLFRRAFLEARQIRYDERNRFGEDFMFYLTCLLGGANWWITPEPLYCYTILPGSLTERQSAADLDRIRALEARLLGEAAVVADVALSAALRAHLRSIDRNFYYRAFTDTLKAGNFGAAARMLLASPASAGHITVASFEQLPAVLFKTLRGGYRAGAGPYG